MFVVNLVCPNSNFAHVYQNNLESGNTCGQPFDLDFRILGGP